MDWEGSLTRHCMRFGVERQVEADWHSLVREWIAGYQPAISLVREGKRAWVNLDQLQRQTLDELLPKHSLQNLSNEDRQLLARGWSLLSPWPDAVEGLKRLKRRYIIGSLSNGATRQLTDMARHGDLPWDVIFGADTFRTYKPDPALYQGAIRLIGSPAETIVMVAAHNKDLQAAKAQGMRAAFIHRVTEDRTPEGDYDFIAANLKDLATQLAA